MAAEARAVGTLGITVMPPTVHGVETGDPADEHADPTRWEHRLVTDDSMLPEGLTLDEAYRAASFLTDLYVASTERQP